MHDLDRTQNLFESDYQEMEYGYEGEGEGEGDYEGESDYEGEGESALDEVEEMELAADFLEVQDEEELEQFLGKLIDKAKKSAGGFLKSAIGQQLGGLLKGAAKQALPLIGNAIVPGAGGVVASKLGSVFGLELEGLSPQDQEFEGARKFVQFANETVQHAVNAPQNAPPQEVAKAAVIQAAQRYAPGLLRPAGDGPGNSYVQPYAFRRDHRRHRHPRSGRWVRRGDKIILFGV